MDNLAILAAELTGDPLGRGYAGMTDEQAAADLNTVYRPAPDRESLTAAEIYDVIDRTELPTADATKMERLKIILGLGGNVNVGPSSQARAELMAIFGAGTNTRAALAALVTGLQQSRASELGLPKIEPGHVQMARTP